MKSGLTCCSLPCRTPAAGAGGRLQGREGVGLGAAGRLPGVGEGLDSRTRDNRSGREAWKERQKCPGPAL